MELLDNEPRGRTTGHISSYLVGAPWSGDEGKRFKDVGVSHVGEDGESVPDGRGGFE